MRRWLILALVAALALAAAFTAGRYSRPAKVVETTRTVEVEKIVYRDVVRTVEVQGPVRVVTKIVTKPGGERVVERVVERAGTTTTTASATTANVDSHSDTRTAKVVTSARPDWSVALGAQWRPSALSLRPGLYDAELSRRIAGGMWLGLTASGNPNDLRSSTVGLRARVEF